MNEGRPSTVTDEAIVKLVAEFEDEATVEFACEEAEISVDAYYRRWREDEEFRKKMVRAQNKPLRDAQKSVIRQIRGNPDGKGKAKKAGDGQLGLRFLERRMPKRYKTQIDVKDVTPPSRRVIVGNDKPHTMFRTEGKKQKKK